MASITIRKLDDAIKEKLKIRAAANGNSMEEEVRRILRSALDEETTDSVQNEKKEFSQLSEEERFEELVRRGILVRAKDPDTRIPPGEPAPGALEEFLADRNRF